MKDAVDTPYTLQVVRNVNPAWSGFPVRRPRVFLLNWRQDVGDPGRLLEPLQTILAEPVPLLHNYWSFLQLTRPVDWSRVDQYPNEYESAALRNHSLLSECVCCVDPMVACPKHPCPPTCRMCGTDGVGCLWRHKMQKYLADTLPSLIPQSKGKLTYTQVLELQGLPGPAHPRQRNCLNVFALLPRSQPLNDTLLLADLSQSVDMRVLQYDGSMPTLARNSAIFCLQAGQFLTTRQKAALMGFRLSHMTFPSQCTESWFRERLGLCIHAGSMGAMLFALIGSPLAALTYNA